MRRGRIKKRGRVEIIMEKEWKIGGFGFLKVKRGECFKNIFLLIMLKIIENWIREV